MQFDRLQRREFITLLGSATIVLPAASDAAEVFPTRVSNFIEHLRPAYTSVLCSAANAARCSKGIM
jgi:hypothetical protein